MPKSCWMLFFLVLRGNHYSEFDEYISTYLSVYLSIYQMDPQAIYPMPIWDPGEVVVESTCLEQCLNYSLGPVESPTKIINLQPSFSVRKLFLFHKMKWNTLFSQHDIMIFQYLTLYEYEDRCSIKGADVKQNLFTIYHATGAAPDAGVQQWTVFARK